MCNEKSIIIKQKHCKMYRNLRYIVTRDGNDICKVTKFLMARVLIFYTFSCVMYKKCSFIMGLNFSVSFAVLCVKNDGAHMLWPNKTIPNKSNYDTIAGFDI